MILHSVNMHFKLDVAWLPTSCKVTSKVQSKNFSQLPCNTEPRIQVCRAEILSSIKQNNTLGKKYLESGVIQPHKHALKYVFSLKLQAHVNWKKDKYRSQTGYDFLCVFSLALVPRKQYLVLFSSSLIIHQVKTKEITTVKEVGITGLNQHRF